MDLEMQRQLRKSVESEQEGERAHSQTLRELEVRDGPAGEAWGASLRGGMPLCRQ